MAGKRNYRGRAWVDDLPEDDVNTTMAMRRRDVIQFRKLAQALGTTNLKTMMGRLASVLATDESSVIVIRDLILESEAKSISAGNKEGQS